MKREWLEPSQLYISNKPTDGQQVIPELFFEPPRKLSLQQTKSTFQLAIPEIDFVPDEIYGPNSTGVHLTSRGAELHGVARRWKSIQDAARLEVFNPREVAEFSYRSLEVGYLPDSDFWTEKSRILDAMQREREERIRDAYPLGDMRRNSETEQIYSTRSPYWKLIDNNPELARIK